jgi:hypothetical protein
MAMAAPARTRARTAARPVTRQAEPARRPRPQEQRRLTLVTDARLRDAHRRRRMRMLAVATGFVVMAALFGLAAFNAVLVSGQDRLDHLQKQVADAQSRYSANRLKVAQLEAPEHVVQVAQQRLGMVPPPGVTYLTPSQAMAAEVGEPAHSGTDTGEDGGGTSWAAVKPYLAGKP